MRVVGVFSQRRKRGEREGGREGCSESRAGNYRMGGCDDVKVKEE